MKYNVGFTGTRAGMTQRQYQRFARFIHHYAYKIGFFNHGDCIGADEHAHDAVLKNNEYELPRAKNIIRICLFPGHGPKNDQRQRAHCKNAYRIYEAEPYLKRNQRIVNNSDLLIACPGEEDEVIRSGTWSTIRYARAKKKPLMIIFPESKMTHVEGQSLFFQKYR